MPSPKQTFRSAALFCLFLVNAILIPGCGGSPTSPKGFLPAYFQFSIDGGPTISASATGMYAWVRSKTDDFGTIHLLVFGGANCPAETRLDVLIARHEAPITPGAYTGSPMVQLSVDYTVGRSNDSDFVWFENLGRDFEGGTVIIDELSDDVISGSFEVELEDVYAFPRNLKRFRGTFRMPMGSGSSCLPFG